MQRCHEIFDHQLEVRHWSLGLKFGDIIFTHNCNNLPNSEINRFSPIALFYLLLTLVRLNGHPLYLYIYKKAPSTIVLIFVKC